MQYTGQRIKYLTTLVYYNELLNDDKTKFLIELDQSGMLAKLYRFGIITHKPKVLLEARLKVADLMKQGVSKAKACRILSGYLGVTSYTIYNYLK